jgi:hypothetical protein
MDVPPYSASPLYSFASSVQPVRRSPSFSETFGAVMRWATGRHRPAPPRERQIEARLIAEIEAEIGAFEMLEFPTSTPVEPPNPIDKILSITSPPRPPRRPRRKA